MFAPQFATHHMPTIGANHPFEIWIWSESAISDTMQAGSPPK